MNPREAREYRPDFIQILIKWLHENESSGTIYVRTCLAYNLRKVVYTKANKIEQVNM